MTPCKAISQRGTVSAQMTAQDIISMAVNVVQNGRSLDDLGCGSGEKALALQEMLGEVYGQILTANRQAASPVAYIRAPMTGQRPDVVGSRHLYNRI